MDPRQSLNSQSKNILNCNCSRITNKKTFLSVLGNIDHWFSVDAKCAEALYFPQESI